MAVSSAIEWTDSTWNPVTGCTKISLGCKNCYAERMAKRLQAAGTRSYRNGFRVTVHERILSLPVGWRKPRMIFVNSMSDLFHHSVPADFVLRVFETMNRADWHVYQVLTKRSDRLLQLSTRLPWGPHIWMGVTIESQDYIGRADGLRQTGAAVKFISLEPLLGPVAGLDFRGIDWVIVGGESGPGARAMNPEWVRGVRDQCVGARVPFFFKQWGGVSKKKAGRILDGREWDEMPPLSPEKAAPHGNLPAQEHPVR